MKGEKVNNYSNESVFSCELELNNKDENNNDRRSKGYINNNKISKSKDNKSSNKVYPLVKMKLTTSLLIKMYSLVNRKLIIIKIEET